MAIYLVGKDETYTSLQAALDQLVTDVGASAFVETHEIVINDARDYAGARVITLNPSNTYRLIIRVAGGAGGRVYDGNGATAAWSGLYIDGVDYVDLKDLELTGFKTGIIFYQSDYGRILNSNVHSNDYMDIEFFESDRGTIANTASNGADASLAIIKSKELVIVHSAIVSDKSAMWVEWRGGPDGNTPVDPDTPIYYAYNNIIASTTIEQPITIEKESIVSLSAMDGNVYWSNNRWMAKYWETYFGQRLEYVQDLDNWTRLTDQDANSTFEDPELLTQTTDGKPGPGLIPGSAGSILEGGLSLDSISENLPIWFEIAIIEEDTDGLPRNDTGTPTPGPNESTTADDYDIFADFLGATSDLWLSDDKIFGVDRAVRQLQRGVDCWNPEVAAGYFYVGDASYYLYAEKLAYTLKDVTWSKVTLDNNMEVEGVSILDTSLCVDPTAVEWFQRGKCVWASHRGASISKPVAESVRVYGYEQSWDSSQQAFIRTPLSREFGITENPKDFFLTPAPQGGAPIVITDDTLKLDTSGYDRAPRDIVPMEYRYQWNQELEKGELKLQGARNLFRNSSFYNGKTDWAESATLETSVLRGERYIASGTNVQLAASTGGSYDYTSDYAFRQRVYREDLDSDLIFSWYMHRESTMHVAPVIKTYYDNGETYSEQHMGDMFVDTSDLTSDWQRFVVHCKTDTTNTLKGYSLPHQQIAVAELGTVDYATSPHVEFELRVNSVGSSEFDGFMAYEGDHLPRYTHLPYGDEMTVEWDSSDAGIYVIDDMAISPILNPQHTGFLTIGPIDVRDLDTSVTEAGHTTLTDTHVPTRLSGLPWAKIDGPDKLHYVSGDAWSLEAFGIAREVSLQPAVPTATGIDVFPNPIKVAQGLRKSFHAIVEDSTGNPYAHKDVSLVIAETNGRYTGELGITEMGSPSNLGISATTKTDPSGAVVATFIAADQRIIDSIAHTSELYNGDAITTFYEPNFDNHANVTLKVAKDDSPVDISGTFTSEILTPTKVSGKNTIQLTDIPVFATATLQVAGTSSYDVDLHETINPSFSEKEFYIDYATGLVTYTGKRIGDAKASYEPLLVWTDTSTPNQLHFHPELVLSVTSDIIVSYDAKSNIELTSGDASRTVPVVLLNPDVN